jgi:hypothetical protein
MTAESAYVPAARPLAQPLDTSVRDVGVGSVIALGLAAVGALLGLVWEVWTPARPPAEVLGNGKFIPDETEAFIAGDGRFLALTAAVGLVAALGAWRLRPANRGVAVAAGLLVGSLVGALLTEVVGHATGGGSATGSVVNSASGQQFRLTHHLPLSLHLGGLVVIEAAVAMLVYGLLVAFAVHDDLGRPDPVRDAVLAARTQASAVPAPAPYGPASVDAGGYPQDGGGYGDAAGPAQQRDLPPQ